MFSAFCLQRTTALFRAICLQRTIALVFCYRFANNCCPFLPLYVCKGLRTSLPAICPQRTPVLAYLFQLQRTAVLISASVCKELWSLPSAIHFAVHLQQTVVFCFLLFIHKGLRSLFTSFVCKGLLSLFPFLYKRTVVLVLCYFICKGLLSLS